VSVWKGGEVVSLITEHANRCSAELRTERARVKASLRRRHVTLAEVFDSPAVQTMRISDLLECVPGLSAIKVSRLLLTLAIAYARPVGSLSPRQTEEIFRVLRYRHPMVKVKP
jgi:hypothetical protein